MSCARFILACLLLGIVINASAVPSLPSGTDNDDTIATRAEKLNYGCKQPEKTNETLNDSQRAGLEAYTNASLPAAMEKLGVPSVFFSGRYSGSSANLMAAVEHCAEKKMGGTIGQIMCNAKKLASLSFTMPESNSDPLWTVASHDFAESTTGTAYAVIGDARFTSTWFTTELPTLRANSKVTAVIDLKPNDCTNICYWFCREPATDPSCKGLAECTFTITDPKI